MTKSFEFEDNGKRYSCRVEARRSTPAEAWWWFTVSGDENRYAPFRVAAGDSQESVKTRIVQYYVDRLERRAQPADPRGHWSQRNKVQPKPAVPATPVPTPTPGT